MKSVQLFGIFLFSFSCSSPRISGLSEKMQTDLGGGKNALAPVWAHPDSVLPEKSLRQNVPWPRLEAERDADAVVWVPTKTGASAPKVAFDGTQWLIVWQDARSGVNGILRHACARGRHNPGPDWFSHFGAFDVRIRACGGVCWLAFFGGWLDARNLGIRCVRRPRGFARAGAGSAGIL
jgi:hypothetical protein